MTAALLVVFAFLGAIVIVALREPDPVTVGAFATCVGIVAAALGARVALLFDRSTPGRRRSSGRPARALRRGLAIGAAIAILVYLRAVDGLTPLTATFVLLPFAVAEVILSARATALR